jgi:hypothetical protein
MVGDRRRRETGEDVSWGEQVAGGGRRKRSTTLAAQMVAGCAVVVPGDG